MKILYVSKFDLPDFQNDMVFHGLRSLFGADVVDANDAWYMYDDMRQHWNARVPENGMSYGRGFTLYGRLPRLNVDRTDLEAKIRNDFFDKIVYGSLRRYHPFLEAIRQYSQKDIIMIDGEDDQDINNYNHVSSNGILFKRELLPEFSSRAKSLNFSIPKELIVSTVPKKEKDYATIIPGDTSTYVYTEEKPYYEDYQKSYFGLTGKKGGWDCLRHYEILMNGCIPWFPDLENCPESTMTKFPKKLVLDVMDEIKKGNDLSFYEECVTMLLDWTRKNLTTEAVAKDILS